MATYLLLRSNRQVGPFTFDELVTNGLKPYDLVWVEGKSAAWRYPSEVEELKSFAPVIEEQPYDRFYKKKEENIAEVKTLTQQKEEKVFVRKHIVNEDVLPKNNTSKITVILPDNVAKRVTISPEPVQYKEEVKKQPTLNIETPVRNIAAVTALPTTKETSHQVVESTFKNSYPQPKNIVKTYKLNSVSLKVYAAMFLLLVAGVAIGLIINKSNPVEKTQIVNYPIKKNNEDLKSIDVAKNNFNKEEPAKNVVEETQHNEQILPQPDDDLKVVLINSKKNSKKVIALTNNADTNNSNAAKTFVDKQPVSKVEKPLSHALSDIVEVNNNKFKVGPFGGINQLQVTVVNKSAHVLDEVAVDVDYILSNKKVFKTERIIFSKVTPHLTVMQEAPKSPRGITVVTRIVSVNAKDIMVIK
jgi:hypothetical protein